MKLTKPMALLAILALVLAACGGNGGEGGDDTTAPAETEAPSETTAADTEAPTTTAGATTTAAAATTTEGEGGGGEGSLTVWIMEPGNPEVQRIVDETAAAFEEESGATVEVQYVPWASAHDQFVTAIGGGQVPDVAEMGTTWTAEFAELGGLAQIEGGLGDEYIDSLVAAGTVEDTAYGYPWYAGARAFIYRTDILEEAGVEPPTNWEELRSVSEAIASSTDVAPIHIAGVNTHMMVPMIWQAGGEIATFQDGTWTPSIDTEEARTALQTYVDLAEWSPEGAIQWNSVDVRDAFANGDSAMMVGGGWDLAAILDANPDLEGNVGVSLVPEGPGGNHDAFAGGSHLVTFEGSENPELAQAFIDYMLQPENVSTFAEEVGFLPGTVAGVEASSASGDELYGPFTTQLVEHSRSYPATAGWGAVEGDATFTNNIQQVMQGAITVEEATANIDATMAELLNQ